MFGSNPAGDVTHSIQSKKYKVKDTDLYRPEVVVGRSEYGFYLAFRYEHCKDDFREVFCDVVEFDFTKVDKTDNLTLGVYDYLYPNDGKVTDKYLKDLFFGTLKDYILLDMPEDLIL